MSVQRIILDHKMVTYGIVSLGLAGAVISKAFSMQSNFYSAAVYLSRSSASVLVLANFGFYISLLWGRVLQRIFFGPLRPSEVEKLYDRIWYFLTESLLAFTIFRDDFDTGFVINFAILLFVKSFHWILSDRIEYMDQIPYPGPPVLFHIRMNVLFWFLWLTDCVMILYVIDRILEEGISGNVLFGNEYAILLAALMNSVFKYLIIVYDIRRARSRGGEQAPPWEDKSMYMFYTELATDFFKLTTYVCFFVLVMSWFGLPLNILRDVYLTARSFWTRTRDLMRYRTATKNMDQRYPNASVEEMAAMDDKTCIICREEMAAMLPGAGQPVDGPNMTAKKLPCGHVFHFHCLRSWLERQQSCPTCRRSVLNPPAVVAPRPAAPQPAAGLANPPINGLPANFPFGFGPVPPNQFAGPAGVWGQAWVNAFNNNLQQPQGAPAAQPGALPVANAPTAPSTPTPTPATSAQDNSSLIAQPDLTTPPPDPRAAAAEAALRRFSDNRGAHTQASTPTRTANINTTMPPLPSPSSSMFSPQSSSATSRFGLSTPPAPLNSRNLPSLIPLFPPASAPLPTLDLSSPLSNLRHSANQARASTSLDQSDLLNLETLDERLRDLERLQGMLWSTVEELVKLRSKLSGDAGAETPVGPSNREARESPDLSKGKAVAEGWKGG